MRNQQTITNTLTTLIIVLVMTLGGSGCSGGGGGGAGDTPTALRVEATGQPAPLWQGSPIAPPLCAATLGQNTELIFTFAGAVDPSSLPQSGMADGSIDIRTTSNVPAVGTFRVRDDPSGAAGNQRQVVFTPDLPQTPGQVGTAGYLGPETYVVLVHGAGGAGPQLLVGGMPLVTEILTCFATCDPIGGGCFSDPLAGPAFVEMTSPPTSDPAPAPIDPATVTVFSATISEPLNPTGIDETTVQLVNVASGAQVPGSVTFHQQGTAPGAESGALIEYVPSSPLLPGVTYELMIDPSIVDFGNNPVAVSDPNGPGGRRLFTTIAQPFCPQAPHVEDFSTTQNVGALSPAVVWDGSGTVTLRTAENLFGDGSYGPLTFMPGPGSLDTDIAPSTGYANGTWDATNLDVPAGANVRMEGSHQVTIRCTGTATIAGILNGSAGTNPMAPLGTVNQGPGNGSFNNGGTAMANVVPGGVGGVGGGSGGRASWQGALRTDFGQPGFGPTIGGAVNAGPFGANPSFGGGAGGDGGFRFPSGGVLGELGGLGGAGGSAWESGGDGQPHTSFVQGCQPVVPALQPISAATGIPAAFVPPVFAVSAGSGGGGGGDRHELSGPGNDDQGGGGGGGGGGLRISAMTSIDVMTTALITCDGAAGGLGNVFFGGGGGGGSGGMIWLQTPGDLTISAGASISVLGGQQANACTDHSSGVGGQGLVQLEDQDGVFNTSFGGAGGGPNVVAIPFPFGSTVTGTATSDFFDAGYGDPDYSASTVVETIDVGNIPGATILVQYQGAHEAVSGGGVPDLSSLSAVVPGSLIDTLDGFRFVRFIVTISYPGTPTPAPGAVPPFASQISIGFSTPVNCP